MSITLTVPEDSAGVRLDRFLASVIADRSRSQIQKPSCIAITRPPERRSEIAPTIDGTDQEVSACPRGSNS